MIRIAAWAAFLFLGAAASWQDFRFRRVSNRLIVAALWTGLALYAALALNTLLASHGLSWMGVGRFYLPASFFESAALHALLSVAAAIGLWYLRVWPAGDAKLFIVCAPLLALIDPNLRGFPRALVLVMLGNVFVAAALFVLARVLAEWTAFVVGLRRLEGRARAIAFLDRLRRRIADERPRAHRYLVFAWNTFALFLACRLSRPFVGWRGGGIWGALAMYAALSLVWDRIRDFFLRWDLAGLSFFAVSCVLIPIGLLRRWDVAAPLLGGGRLALGFWLFLPAAQVVLDYYLRSTATVPLEAALLSPGMVLTEDGRRALEVADPEAESPGRYSDGLTTEEAASIREKWGGKGLLVAVHSPRPFALWVFVGCLWTVLFRREIAECLIQLF